MNIETLIQEAKMSAENLLAKQGEIYPAVFVHHGKNVGSLPYNGQENNRVAVVGTIQVLRAGEMFDYAVLLSEAWMSKLPLDTDISDPKIPRPSQDPNREECVIAHIITNDNQSGTGFWPIVRDSEGKNPRLGDRKIMDAGKTQCWLDEALAPLMGEKK